MSGTSAGALLLRLVCYIQVLYGADGLQVQVTMLLFYGDKQPNQHSEHTIDIPQLQNERTYRYYQ